MQILNNYQRVKYENNAQDLIGFVASPDFDAYQMLAVRISII